MVEAILTAAIAFKTSFPDSCLDLDEKLDLRENVGETEGVLLVLDSSQIELGMMNESVETLGSSPSTVDKAFPSPLGSPKRRFNCSVIDPL